MAIAGHAGNVMQAGLLLVLAIGPTNAQSPDLRFDAVCDGVGIIAPRRDALKDESRTPGTRRYRIDLESKRWCQDACVETFDIYAISKKFLILRSESDRVSESFISINRESGRVVDRNVIRSTNSADDAVFGFSGECRREVFSGFPVPRF